MVRSAAISMVTKSMVKWNEVLGKCNAISGQLKVFVCFCEIKFSVGVGLA
jgi:hypothetical protein